MICGCRYLVNRHLNCEVKLFFFFFFLKFRTLMHMQIYSYMRAVVEVLILQLLLQQQQSHIYANPERFKTGKRERGGKRKSNKFVRHIIQLANKRTCDKSFRFSV